MSFRYLREIDIDANIVGYNVGFGQDFRWQAYHIARYFEKLVYRKIKNEFTKFCFSFHPKPPENGRFEERASSGEIIYRDKYVPYVDALRVNAYFDFDQYARFENDIDKNKMITDVFERELIDALVHCGVGAEGKTAAINAFNEIRRNDYVYRGTYKKPLASPNKKYKVWFDYACRIDVIDVYARVRKPRAKHDLHACHFATIPANWDAPDGYIESIVWLSEDEFVAKRGDVTWRQRRFNIAECKVDYYN